MEKLIKINESEFEEKYKAMKLSEREEYDYVTDPQVVERR